MTYTVMVANPEKKEIGIALTTVTINCARIAPFHHNLVPNWTENGLVAAPQATVNPHNAHRLFELRGQGKNFAEIEQILAAEDEHWSWRQVGAITAEGEIFAYTGKDAWDHASHIAGTNSLAIGNFLDGQHVTVANRHSRTGAEQFVVASDHYGPFGTGDANDRRLEAVGVCWTGALPARAAQCCDA